MSPCRWVAQVSDLASDQRSPPLPPAPLVGDGVEVACSSAAASVLYLLTPCLGSFPCLAADSVFFAAPPPSAWREPDFPFPLRVCAPPLRVCGAAALGCLVVLPLAPDFEVGALAGRVRPPAEGACFPAEVALLEDGSTEFPFPHAVTASAVSARAVRVIARTHHAPWNTARGVFESCCFPKMLYGTSEMKKPWSASAPALNTATTASFVVVPSTPAQSGESGQGPALASVVPAMEPAKPEIVGVT